MFKASLGRKIMGLFLLIGLLPLGILSILFYVQMRTSLKTTVSNNLITLAQEVGSGVERTIFTAFVNIKTLSENPILRSDKATNKDKLAEMLKIQDFYMIFEDITLVDLNGNVIVSTTYNYRGAWKTKNWYQQAKQGLAVVSEPHILMSPYKIAMVTTAPVVSQDNQIMAVVAGQINMEKVWEITDRAKVGKTGFVFLVNKEGNLIAYPDKNRIFTKISPLLEKILSEPVGTAEYQIRELGKQVCGFVFLQGYLDYKGQGWRIGVSQNVKEAYGIIQTVQNTVFFIGFGLCLIILFVSIRLTGGIVRPVRTLVAGTEKVAEGDLTHQVEILSKDEIGQLAVAFNQMTKDLKKSREKIEDYSRTLEQKVEERTRELNAAQSQLIQSAKMAAVGQLSAGVAHEINTPLGTILTNTEMLMLEGSITDSQRECLELTKESSLRCKVIVEQLLKYSRLPGLEFEMLNIAQVIDESCLLLERQLADEGVRVNREYSLIPKIKANANELRQVFTNIILNARDAIKKTFDDKKRQGEIRIRAYQEGRSLVVEVQDDGCGIPPEDIGKIFDPFFTTKDIGEGTGLGLSVSHRIIERHGGRIEARSKVGQGTTMRVELPIGEG